MAIEDTKRLLINVTYTMLKERGYKKTTAREIAREAGCTATMIYKCFDNMDYLLTIASLKFLEPYNTEASEIANRKDNFLNSVEQNKAAWRLFIYYAFRYPEVYENLFWGEGKFVYEDAVVEYFQLFPEELNKKSTAYFYTTLFTPDISERDFIWLRRGVSEGCLKMEDVSYISRVDSMIVRGMLLDYMSGQQSEQRRDQMIEECIALVEKTMDVFMNGSS